VATAIPPKAPTTIFTRLFGRSRNGAGEELVGPIRGEVLGLERLGERARAVARGHHLLPAQKQRGSGPLLQRLDDTKNVLDRVYQELNRGAERGLDISPAGDWLLDNFYIVQEHIREIRTSLPKSYYEELPKLSTGSLSGYPRAYEVAIELIAHTEGHLDLDNITLFVREYQTVTPLRMGELWAIPTMLRLGLVENIRRMALRVAARLQEVESRLITWALESSHGNKSRSAALRSSTEPISALPSLSSSTTSAPLAAKWARPSAKAA